ncbi:DUF5004 domain-containing protein [Mucilaginibacter sp. UR6-11]|uniref:DUF5004 domain-containing protein n=1 Tax=Mucilaginibacter sp. UR6-11 TaxID=1435644 RepID=UPI001E5963A5|nr:DUF5004 domain-containing protein [Mucilaginibacter sp. UR6-11]MCC8424045.1 DUF5004 domain-containing protein [Mucilaginibacter sp. UR6-11]
MRNKLLYLLIPAVLLTGLFINSCKKDNQNSIGTLLTNGAWQLSSVRVTESVGDTVKLDTILNTNCDTIQLFTFKTDQTCTYSNFDCKHQPVARGTWSVTANRLFLSANMVCQDTTAAGSSKPFTYCAINTLGNYSMVLYTGDIVNYSTTSKRRVVRYGFVRQKAATK